MRSHRGVLLGHGDSAIARTDRRTFIGVFARGLIAVPLAARCAATRDRLRIGYLSLRLGPIHPTKRSSSGCANWATTPTATSSSSIAGRAMTCMLEKHADELVRLRVDVIVTAVTPAVRAASKATASIPIVMVAAADPVGTGLVASLSHPGGNLTGFSFLSTDLAGKRLELPPGDRARRGAGSVACLARWRARSEVEAGRTDREIHCRNRCRGQRLGVEVSARVIRNAGDLPKVFAAMGQARAQALIVQVSSLAYQHRATIIDAARRLHLPDMYESRELVEAGGLCPTART